MELPRKKKAMSKTHIFFPSGSTAPSGPGPPHDHTHLDTLHSVGLLWTSDQPDSETYLTTLTTGIHVPGGIRTRNPSKRTAANPRLRPRGHWDRQNT